MRIWSIHPCHLDAKGLVALWRETLLAQNVLLGKTKGYKNHPQLLRFKNTTNPVGAIASYLRVVADEADSRGYHFDRSKIVNRFVRKHIPVTRGQIAYEREHLLAKLKLRDHNRFVLFTGSKTKIHPLFLLVRGAVESWEIIN